MGTPIPLPLFDNLSISFFMFLGHNHPDMTGQTAAELRGITIKINFD
jgi:hypothetical protein